MQQVAAPAFVSTLSICIVFLPVVLLVGVARYLFTPLALAVVFAMLASYFLSRTLVPTMMHSQLFATLGTLFLVPTLYSLLKKQPPVDYAQEIADESGLVEGGKIPKQMQGKTQEQPASWQTRFPRETNHNRIVSTDRRIVSTHGPRAI